MKVKWKMIYFERSTHQRILKKSIMVSTKIFSSITTLTTHKDKNWSNGSWKFSFTIAEIHQTLKYIKLKTAILNCNNISSYYSIYCIFGHINAALVSTIRFFQKLKINILLTVPKLLNTCVCSFSHECYYLINLEKLQNHRFVDNEAVLKM